MVFGNSLSASEREVPGLGFDYPHLAAIGGNFRFNPPSTNQHIGRRPSTAFTSVLVGGFPYYGYVDSADYQDVQQVPQHPQVIPQVIVIQQPAPAEQSSADSRNDSAIPAASPATAEPVRDVGEFVLIRRDGKLLFASAYSVIGANLRYVTPEGISRTLPLAELDADSTRSMNEARGTTIQLQN